MFNRIKISLVDQNEKYEKVKLVKPNIIYNRFDIKYSGDFDVLKVQYNEKIQYISIHIHENNVCYIGIYMTEIEQCVFDSILKFLEKRYKNIEKFHITQSLISHVSLVNKMHWLLELPDSIDKYYSKFSSKTIYNRRRELKKLQDSFNIEFIYYSKNEINEELIKRFFELKEKTEDSVYYNTSEKGITRILSKFYNITDAYVLKIDNKIEAAIFYSINDDQDLYCENMVYNKSFAHYSIGSILFYYSIERLIERKFKYLYLGGGDYGYKKICKAIKSNTMSGNIDICCNTPVKSLLKFIFNCNNSKTHKIITILGIKFKFKQKPKKFSKSKLLRKYFIQSNIKGYGNKINAFYNGRWHKLKTKSPHSNFWIKGNNNVVKFHFDTRKLPEGLDFTINGSNNVVDIYKSTYKNTYIQIYRDKNRLLLKEQNIQRIKDAHIYISYGGSMFIGKDCELGNGGLELAVAGDYIEKHKMVIGDNTHIARDTIIRTSDGQSLIDPDTMLPTDPPEDVIIGNNVWIMSRCIILKGSYLADGCAVAANSLVNKKFEEENLLICGTPAKIMKRNIRWSSPYGKYMEQLEKKVSNNENS